VARTPEQDAELARLKAELAQEGASGSPGIEAQVDLPKESLTFKPLPAKKVRPEHQAEYDKLVQEENDYRAAEAAKDAPVDTRPVKPPDGWIDWAKEKIYPTRKV